MVSDEPHPNEALRALASDAACERAGVGAGRRLLLVKGTFMSSYADLHLTAFTRYEAKRVGRYDVSLCDVTQGGHVLLYDTAGGGLLVARRSLPTTLYALLLLLSVVLMFGLTAQEPSITPTLHAAYVMTAATAVACSLIHTAARPIYGLAKGDVAYGVLTTCAGVVYTALASRYRADQNLRCSACLHALDTMIVAFYNTPETPFSGIVAAFVCVRAWSALLGQFASPSIGGLFGLAATCAHGALLTELGVRPQLWHPLVRASSGSSETHQTH